MNSNETIINSLLEYSRNSYEEAEYPALAAQSREWSRNKPLSGIRILDATPLFANTLLKYVPLLAAGCRLTAAVHDAIPYDPAIPPLLEDWGVPVARNARSGEYDCILDCGGVHTGLNPKYGFGELTRSGFYHYQDAGKPVILVDDSRIKAIETCLGTGDGFLRGMKELGFTDFAGRKILIFGYGKVGRGIAYYSAREGAEVTVADVPETKVPANIRLVSRFDREAVLDAVRKAWCVVTATGIRNAMNGNGAAEILRSGPQLVAAMGIENEWGDSLPPERILNRNVPLNFLLKEPTRLRYIDPTMALSNAAAVELLKGGLPAGIQKIAKEIEKHWWDIVEKNGLIAEELKGCGI